MTEAPHGKWVVVRSDRLVIAIEKADLPYVIGRGRQLPASQQLLHKYASRKQLTFVWHPPYLHVVQNGKNPSFIGAQCDPVPTSGAPVAASSDGDADALASAAPLLWESAQLSLVPSPSAVEAVLAKPHKNGLRVEVPLMDPMTVMQAPDRHAVTASTIYLPEELGLPTLTVRFESTDVVRDGTTAAASTKTAEEMLAVPTFGRMSERDECSDEEHSIGQLRVGVPTSGQDVSSVREPAVTDAPASGKKEWRGLLDVALQEQQRQDAAKANEEQKEVQRHSSLPSPPTSQSQVQPLAPVKITPTPPPPPPAPLAAPAPVQRDTPAPTPTRNHQRQMGFWEWRCHVDGKEDDPKSWRKYNRAVAELLEKAYRDPAVAKVNIPNSTMLNKPDARGAQYGVCFSEKSLNGAMIQYSLDDPGRYRVIRRTGGLAVDRKRAKMARVVPSSSESSESSSVESSDSEESASSSSSSSSTSSSESEHQPKRPRRR